MNRPGFAEGVVLALLGALSTSVLAQALMMSRPPYASAWSASGLSLGLWLVLILLLGWGYGLYLLARSPIPVGRLWLALLWGLVSLCCALFSARFIGDGFGIWFRAWLFSGLGPLLAVQLGFIWLIRVWCFHPRPLAALLDAALLIGGTLAALWALTQSGSLLLASWTWLLTQALFVLIPPPGSATPTESAATDNHMRFAAAERAAERALRRLATGDFPLL
ncbi:hypothetical protein [Rhabdochromatium marinum]|uniref:hypothetical protein n=1 Tax=Rhabdochromatium marinum TaxID=48729 RepID=UPI0019040A45|nr:hypothetical protein [Rhabdochromatium marinum]MBK1647209.1 hypothetical protein [Rhabdochromatium marinum]